ncbi:prepilin-type N-terminal cleavage/methylation domain-containing protein [bacterium]|nr:MAG: prepilin-type N-terminal cleavage/methylation domain-containing protein [bacterium]
MRRAFTLIELLVVIAIIAILAAILFPVFAQAKAAAKKTQCLSNQKQIGTSLYLYLNDSDDTLPMANYPAAPGYMGPPFTKFSWHTGEGKAELNWADLMLPYTKNIDMFKCPDDSTGLATTGGVKVPGKPLSYALNSYFFSQPNNVRRFALTGGSMSEITASASKIFIAESSSNSNFELMRPDRYKAPDGTVTLERHLGGANYVYADTHAKYHKMPQVWKTLPTTAWNNPDTAQNQPFPQWFPWLEDTSEKW